MRLPRLLVEATPTDLGRVMAWELAETCLRADLPGLPGHMRAGAREAAWGYVRAEEWADHLLLCLLLIQARTGAESASEVTLKRELEEILLDILFGPLCVSTSRPRTDHTWLDSIGLRRVNVH